jgi:hypothetical protein
MDGYTDAATVCPPPWRSPNAYPWRDRAGWEPLARHDISERLWIGSIMGSEPAGERPGRTNTPSVMRPHTQTVRPQTLDEPWMDPSTVAPQFGRWSANRRGERPTTVHTPSARPTGRLPLATHWEAIWRSVWWTIKPASCRPSPPLSRRPPFVRRGLTIG